MSRFDSIDMKCTSSVDKTKIASAPDSAKNYSTMQHNQSGMNTVFTLSPLTMNDQYINEPQVVNDELNKDLVINGNLTDIIIKNPKVIFDLSNDKNFPKDSVKDYGLIPCETNTGVSLSPITSNDKENFDILNKSIIKTHNGYSSRNLSPLLSNENGNTPDSTVVNLPNSRIFTRQTSADDLQDRLDDFDVFDSTGLDENNKINCEKIKLNTDSLNDSLLNNETFVDNYSYEHKNNSYHINPVKITEHNTCSVQPNNNNINEAVLFKQINENIKNNYELSSSKNMVIDVNDISSYNRDSYLIMNSIINVCKPWVPNQPHFILHLCYLFVSNEDCFRIISKCDIFNEMLVGILFHPSFYTLGWPFSLNESLRISAIRLLEISSRKLYENIFNQESNIDEFRNIEFVVNIHTFFVLLLKYSTDTTNVDTNLQAILSNLLHIERTLINLKSFIESKSELFSCCTNKLAINGFCHILIEVCTVVWCVLNANNNNQKILILTMKITNIGLQMVMDILNNQATLSKSINHFIQFDLFASLCSYWLKSNFKCDDSSNSTFFNIINSIIKLLLISSTKLRNNTLFRKIVKYNIVHLILNMIETSYANKFHNDNCNRLSVCMRIIINLLSNENVSNTESMCKVIHLIFNITSTIPTLLAISIDKSFIHQGQMNNRVYSLTILKKVIHIANLPEIVNSNYIPNEVIVNLKISLLDCVFIIIKKACRIETNLSIYEIICCYEIICMLIKCSHNSQHKNCYSCSCFGCIQLNKLQQSGISQYLHCICMKLDSIKSTSYECNTLIDNLTLLFNSINSSSLDKTIINQSKLSPSNDQYPNQNLFYNFRPISPNSVLPTKDFSQLSHKFSVLNDKTKLNINKHLDDNHNHNLAIPIPLRSQSSNINASSTRLPSDNMAYPSSLKTDYKISCNDKISSKSDSISERMKYEQNTSNLKQTKSSNNQQPTNHNAWMKKMTEKPPNDDQPPNTFKCSIQKTKRNPFSSFKNLFVFSNRKTSKQNINV